MLWEEIRAKHVTKTDIPLWMLIVAKNVEANMPACRCVVQDCSKKSNRELESLCVRKRAIMNLPSVKRSFALTAPTSTPRGCSRSAQFIPHPTALSGPFIKKEHRDDWLLELFLQFGNRLWRAQPVPYRLEVGAGWVNKPLTFPKLFAGLLVSAV